MKMEASLGGGKQTDELEDLFFRAPLITAGVIGDKSNADKVFSSGIGMTSLIKLGKPL